MVLKETEESEKEDGQADTGFDKYEKKIDKVTRGPKEYQAFRKAVLKRDNNKCVFCGSGSKSGYPAMECCAPISFPFCWWEVEWHSYISSQ